MDELTSSITPDSPWIEHFRQYGQLEALTRETLVRMVERVLVYQGGRVEIIFRYQEQFELAAACAAEQMTALGKVV